jgi:hypothetical protein
MAGETGSSDLLGVGPKAKRYPVISVAPWRSWLAAALAGIFVRLPDSSRNEEISQACGSTTTAVP